MMTTNCGLDLWLTKHNVDSKTRRVMLLLLVIASLTAFPVLAKAQSLAMADLEDSSSTTTVAHTAPVQFSVKYMRPTQSTKLHNYVFDMIGPYPILGAAFAAGISQATNTPPEWKQGASGYGKRYASDFGIAAISTTTRYALAEALKEDTLYYRCECKGVFPRLGHAVFSTLTARRGEDGHRVFSLPALVAPYAGSMIAVYGWYPGRYDDKDAFRMGNYALLGYVGWNIAREFVHGGPHSMFSRMHMDNSHAAPAQGSNP